MLPNINFFNSPGGNLKSSMTSNQSNDQLMKTIETKLQQQNTELQNRAKVIEELKLSLSLFIDKYNELKKNIEKGKYGNSNFTINTTNSNKNHTLSLKTSSSFIKLKIDRISLQILHKKNTLNDDEDLEKFQTNYIFMLEQNKNKEKLIKEKEIEIRAMQTSLREKIESFEKLNTDYIDILKSNENNLLENKKLLDELKILKSEKDSHFINFNSLLALNEDLKSKLHQVEEKLMSSESYSEKYKSEIYLLKFKYEKEIECLKSEIKIKNTNLSNITDEKLKNYESQTENEILNIKSCHESENSRLKSEIVNMLSKIKINEENIRNYLIEIETLKNELKSQKEINQKDLMQLKLLKSEYTNKDSLIEELKKNIENISKSLQKESKIQKNIENEKQMKSFDFDNLNKTLSEKDKMIKFLDEEILKLKSNYSNIENKLKDFQDRENKFIKNINMLKNALITMYENLNKNYLSIEQKYKAKLIKQNEQISKIKNNLLIIKNNYDRKFLTYNKTESKSNHSSSNSTNSHSKTSSISETLLKNNLQSEFKDKELNYKCTIEKLELEKTKLMNKIENYERFIKENKLRVSLNQNNKTESSKSEVEQASNTIKILNTKLEWLQKEYNKLKINDMNYKDEILTEKENYKILNKKFCDLEVLLNQYKVENIGKSKIIEERNEEVKLLKEEILRYK